MSPLLTKKIGGIHVKEINYSYNGQRTLREYQALQFEHDSNVVIKNLCLYVQFWGL